MSRLDSIIRRLDAQRRCLDLAVSIVKEISGPVLELGLGNGRTFDHLRELFPEREIYVFDRQIAAHPDCIPEPEFMFLGDFSDTLPKAAARIGRRSVLAHCDIGSGVAETDRETAKRVARLLAPLMTDGAVIVADQEMNVPDWQSISLPEGVARERYFMYRVSP